MRRKVADTRRTTGTTRGACASRRRLGITPLLTAGPTALLTVLLAWLIAPAALAEPLPSVSAPPPPASPAALEDLLSVPDFHAFRFEDSTDEALASAVAKGTNPDLEPPRPFRKRNNDLFRTEREVEFMDREMKVRLRLRAKTKRAISVQLKF